MNVTAGDLHSLRSTTDHFVHRLLTDCLNEMTRAWWLRRAETFERARPQPGEFHGAATTDELRQRWRHLTEVATACRARAGVAPLEDIDPDVASVLGDGSAA